MVRFLGFITGMIFCELIFSFLLVVQQNISFDLQSYKSDWIVLAIELVFGIMVFMLAFGIAIVGRNFLRKVIWY